MNIAFGSDHVGAELKWALMAYLAEKGHSCTDLGCLTAERCDYPVYGYKVGKAVAAGEYELGVLLCGTGVGISLAANKVCGIRAAVCSEPYSAKLARQHNHANILAMGARVLGVELAKMILDEFLSAVPQGGRHFHRVSMINEIDETGALSAADQ